MEPATKWLQEKKPAKSLQKSSKKSAGSSLFPNICQWRGIGPPQPALSARTTGGKCVLHCSSQDQNLITFHSRTFIAWCQGLNIRLSACNADITLPSCYKCSDCYCDFTATFHSIRSPVTTFDILITLSAQPSSKDLTLAYIVSSFIKSRNQERTIDTTLTWLEDRWDKNMSF